MQTGTHKFSCDACGRIFSWKQSLAGRRVKCACGHILLVAESPPHGPGDLYELADAKPRPHPRPAETVMTTPDKVGEGAVAPSAGPARRVEYIQPGTPGATWFEIYFPDRVKDFYLPLTLIAAGAAIEIGSAWLTASRAAHVPRLLLASSIDMIARTVFMLLAIAITARARGISLGPLPVAIMKLCAVAVGGYAFAIVLSPLFSWLPFIGWIAALVLPFVGYFTLLGALFDLDESDTWYCVCAFFVVGLVLTFTVAGLRARGWF